MRQVWRTDDTRDRWWAGMYAVLSERLRTAAGDAAAETGNPGASAHQGYQTRRVQGKVMQYEYECCGQRFTRLLPISERDNAKCSKCGKPAKRLIAAGVRHEWVGPPEWASAWKAGNKF